jgi:flagellar motor switch protein FliG
MSKRAAALLSEDMDYLGPTRITDVRKAQDEIVEIILKLEAQGEIVIPMGEEDQIFV